MKQLIVATDKKANTASSVEDLFIVKLKSKKETSNDIEGAIKGNCGLRTPTVSG